MEVSTSLVLSLSLFIPILLDDLGRRTEPDTKRSAEPSRIPTLITEPFYSLSPFESLSSRTHPRVPSRYNGDNSLPCCTPGLLPTTSGHLQYCTVHASLALAIPWVVSLVDMLENVCSMSLEPIDAGM